MKSYDEVFDALPDFDLCDSVSCAIEECYGFDHLKSWPDEVPLVCRVMHCIWSVNGFLECEGYARFFSLDCEHRTFPLSMRTIGIDVVAQSIEDSLALVPADCLGSTDGLTDHFGSWEALCETVESHEDLLFRNSSRIEAALCVYVRSQKEVFRVLLPHLRKQNSWKEGD